MEDTTEVRNNLLMELIGKMQDRLAEKNYPAEKPQEPAESIEKAVEEVAEPAKEDAPSEETPEDLELEEELIKTHLVE